MSDFRNYEDVINYFLENTQFTRYKYGLGVSLLTNADEGGVIEVDNDGCVNIWSGLGFSDYEFKTKIKSPDELYNLINMLTKHII